MTDAVTQIIEAGRFLYAQGWSPATSSNYSVRCDAHSAYITVSGRHKGQLSAEDVMRVDWQGQAVGSDLRPSAETLLHTQVYEFAPHVGAVLHTHSVAATVWSRQLSGHWRVQGYELLKALPGVESHEAEVCIPLFENTQDLPALAAQVLQYVQQQGLPPGYLIRGHGLYTWGQSMADALRHVEALEFLLRCEMEQGALS